MLLSINFSQINNDYTTLIQLVTDTVDPLKLKCVQYIFFINVSAFKLIPLSSTPVSELGTVDLI